MKGKLIIIATFSWSVDIVSVMVLILGFSSIASCCCRTSLGCWYPTLSNAGSYIRFQFP